LNNAVHFCASKQYGISSIEAQLENHLDPE